jgi:hypothetical protein
MARNEKINQIPKKDLLEFLKEQKTAEEIASAFKLDNVAKITKLLPQKIDGHQLVEFRNQKGEKVYLYYQPNVTPGRVEKKIWTPKFDAKDTSVILIKFPDNLDWREIRVAQLAESHIGTRYFDEKRFKEYIQWINKNPCVFVLLNGAILGIPPAGSREFKEYFVRKNQEILINYLLPVAHKVLWAHQGCTEEKIERSLGFDPLEEVCQNLRIPYFKRPVNAEIAWKKHHYSFFCIHGATNARKRGSILNAIHQLLESLDSIDFIIMSHPRAGYADYVARMKIIMEQLDIQFEPQHLILTPGFYIYEGSPEERKNGTIYPYGSTACILYADGHKGITQ